MHPNHYTKVQRLLSEDYAPRLELQEHEENTRFLANVLLTDESKFCHKGTFNSHNLHVWSGENPQFEHLFYKCTLRLMLFPFSVKCQSDRI
jgi:hypothetical protein